ncbi:MAG: hypothetical protein JO372_11715, partial [Solirubrobacterales bacterium]|nr:hypothetical protein [Solirubrobacterales bacterium]
AGVKLSCPRGQSYCDGTVSLTTVRRFTVAGKRGALVLGTQHFHILGGRGAVVVVKLSRHALSRLGASLTVAVLIQVTARDAAGHRAASHRTGTLVLRGGR